MTEPTPAPSGDRDDETIFDQLLREETENQALYAALYYASLGLPVFPVRLVTDDRGKTIKKPQVKDWPNKASVDPIIVTRWWTELSPGAMVGVVTGHRSGWCVLDVDVKHGARGLESLKVLADELVPLESSTRGIAFGDLVPEDRLRPAGLVRTRSGGLHLWYRLPDDKTATRGRMKVRGLPGLELKATGNYVVAPPSAGYEWLRHLPAEPEPGVASDEHLRGCEPVPEALLARLTDGGADGWSGAGDDDESKLIMRGEGGRLLREAVRTLMGTPEGEGNNTVYGLCCDLYPYVALGELTKLAVDQAVWAGIRGWGADEATISGTMGSAWRRTGERTLRFFDELLPRAPGDDPGAGGETEVPDADESLRSLAGLAALAKAPPEGVRRDDTEPSPPASGDDTAGPGPGPRPGEPITDASGADAVTDERELDEVRSMIPADMLDSPETMRLITERVFDLRVRDVARDLFRITSQNEHGWEETDLGSEDDDPVPGVLENDLGRGLCYASEFNMVWGKRSAGKSWLTALAIRQQVRAGRHAVILDYENGRPRIRNRLRQVGLTADEIRDQVHVFISQVGGVSVRRLRFNVADVGVVVIDSMTGALRAMDLDSLRGDDIETFSQRLVAPFRTAGACVLALDHVTHDDMKHDRPINSVHKLNMVQGSGYQLETVVPFAPGTPGWSWVRLWKDNGGGTDRVIGDNVARLCVDGKHDGVEIALSTDLTSLAVLAAAGRDKVEDIVQRLDELGVRADMAVRQTAEVLRAAGTSVGQNDVSAAQKQRRSRPSERGRGLEDGPDDVDVVA